ncbi:MAG: hypothetical protein ACRC2V_01220 [Xenococcaceae cyanobacterium]
MTKINSLANRVIKISISLDPESLYYLDSLVGDRSSNIRAAIAQYRIKQEQRAYSQALLKRRERD